MISDANKAVNDLASIVPLLGGSSSRKDYEEARKLVEYLLEHDPDSPLVDILTARIEALLQIVGGDKLIIPFC